VHEAQFLLLGACCASLRAIAGACYAAPLQVVWLGRLCVDRALCSVLCCQACEQKGWMH
jgi:hypothetical protein